MANTVGDIHDLKQNLLGAAAGRRSHCLAYGVFEGFKLEMTEERIAGIKSGLRQGEPKAKITKAMGVSRDTLYWNL